MVSDPFDATNNPVCGTCGLLMLDHFIASPGTQNQSDGGNDNQNCGIGFCPGSFFDCYALTGAAAGSVTTFIKKSPQPASYP